MKLPLIRRERCARALAGGYLAFCALYLFAGHVHLVPPTRLAPSAFDRSLPFLDWSVALYLTQFGLLASAIWLGADDAKRSRAFWSMLLATAISFVIFMIWPTIVERPPQASSGPFAPLWTALYLFDRPTNGFPSLHAALALIAAIALAAEGRAWRLAGPLWAAAILFSTLTTKQHVALDLAGGLAVGGASWLALRSVSFSAAAGREAGSRSLAA
jgi:membrane-associated phospholipid phosphatase